VPDEFRGAPGEPGGYYASRGNCTAPNECTCWCKAKYIENICLRKGGVGLFGPWTAHRECRGPFQDLLGKGPAFSVMDMVNYRNLLDPDEMFGTRSCRRGFEGTVNGCVEINQCVGCTRQFFTKSFLGDDAAVLARWSGEEPASPRHRAGVASTAWRSTRRFKTNAP
jgi:hypothetical protein